MALTVAEEKAYYERQYARFLQVSPDDLRFCPTAFLRDLDNPRKEVYERRALYAATLAALARLDLSGKHVLDYGCGTGDFGLWMATAESANVTFLDLSANAVAVCLLRAEASGVAHLCAGEARDAANLSCFPDASFDVVYGCASLHHTLKYPGAWRELLRVLKPDGALVLTETYGNNRLLNVLRRWNWRRSNLPQEQGEDVIFDDTHLAVLRQSFTTVQVRPMHLLAMAKRPLRGRYDARWVRAVLSVLDAADRALLWLFPRLKRYCGEVLVVASARTPSV
ncbi:MAG: class I SAM-dependent methyltransferase [Bryobacterales bacterium]|jgi:ubiquinone/menaquinone biosynthesis C-methylase UbiE|nr:class I SAM-dependent methyltransferase [Bryobacterales bacterium]